jgi:putative endonuclease
MKTDKRRLGDVGERATCMFLGKHGFKILDRNYLKKWGEIDIVSEKDGLIHFVEVKSISVRSANAGMRAEDNMHPGKIKRIHRTIQTYLLEKRVDKDWQLDLSVVRIDEDKRTATVEMLQNIV